MVHGVLNNVFLEHGGLPFIFPFKVHLELDTIATLSGTWGFYLNHVIPLRPFKTVLENVLLKHCGLHCDLPCAVHLTWDTLLTLRSTWGFYLNHLIPLRPFKSVFDNVRLEHGGLPHVLPFAVHRIFLPEQVEGVILSHFYSSSFLVRGLLYA